jgi:hypothetical protein
VRAIKTAMQMIQTATLGTRHHTRFKAARLLGGYVAGGLLSYDQAYTVLEQALIDHTDDLKRALKTVADGLAYGQVYPITLEALEAERQAWLEAHLPISDNGHPRQSNRLPMNGDRQEASEPAVSDPWGDLHMLPVRPYTGYRGYGKGGTHG